ncbi:unnamed protein product [Bursaphelenchus okinawaensis]|uniref:Enoyl reductase (ER) domain-containing protein n=1 Tax=Bursaphelenchus okinawaensis TaxID=465554 RepID=A0A811JUV8_9BILA|nr:unnamed protein product [Bursaphelenchus okinawaensis]CAG9084063.1 unnamed protein product [Bursaphelenchus okinawaensis]
MASNRQISATMFGYVCDDYNQQPMVRELTTPRIRSDNEVLIKVKASSVNPIDVRMSEGYAHQLMTAVNNLQERRLTGDNRLPTTFGRDFSGVVAEAPTSSAFKVGDEVIGVVPPAMPGAHSEYVITNTNYIIPKPKTVDHVNAAAMIYTTATAWSALTTFGRLNATNARNQRVLIHGGSGGVGSSAIQILKYWGTQKIVATASTKNQAFVKKLGAVPVDYTADNVKELLLKEGPFDLILDCTTSNAVTDWSDELLGVWRNSVHLTLTSPLMQQTDRYGVPLGLASTAATWFCRNVWNFKKGRAYIYAFFIPDKNALNLLSTLIDQGKMVPNVEKVYHKENISEAYETVGKLQGGGKSVISFE